jgi:hypothetical protein
MDRWIRTKGRCEVIYTKRQIEIMCARLQEYVDIGWNKGTTALTRCKFCIVFVGDDEDICGTCPMGVSEVCDLLDATDRRDVIEAAGTQYEAGHREAARVHALWLVGRYNSADEGGEWSIE